MLRNTRFKDRKDIVIDVEFLETKNICGDTVNNIIVTYNDGSCENLYQTMEEIPNIVSMYIVGEPRSNALNFIMSTIDCYSTCKDWVAAAGF